MKQGLHRMSCWFCLYLHYLYSWFIGACKKMCALNLKLQDGHIVSKNVDCGCKMPFFKIKAVKMQEVFFLQVRG